MKIFQIFYNEATRLELDPAFIPLDNCNSERPDWYEYWPIRQFLRTCQLEDNEYIGFFSPRFKEKTSLTGQEVFARMEFPTHDVVNFSPLLDQSSMFTNSFLQANVGHPGCLKMTQSYLDTVGIDIQLSRLIQDQTRIVFSNYFVAKYSFWKKWDALTTQFFEFCEQEDNALADALNANTVHRGQFSYPMKIFVMERMISLLLEIEDTNTQIAIDHAKVARYGVGPIFNSFLLLDALKGQYVKTKSQYYLGLYMGIRAEQIKAISLLGQ